MKMRPGRIATRWLGLTAAALAMGLAIAPAVSDAVENCVSEQQPCEDIVLNGWGCSTGCLNVSDPQVCCAYTEWLCVGWGGFTFRTRTCYQVGRIYCADHGFGFDCYFFQ